MGDLQKLLASAGQDENFDLSALLPYLEYAMPILRELIEKHREIRRAEGTLYDWVDDSSLARDIDLEQEWIPRMLERFSCEEFRPLVQLFVLQERALTSRNSRLYPLRDVSGRVLYRNENSLCTFHYGDKVASLCHSAAVILTKAKPGNRCWQASFDSERNHLAQGYVWDAFDHPEGEKWLRPLCRQLARREIWLNRDGTFSPSASAPASPFFVQLDILREAWPSRIRGLLVGALAKRWMTVEEAENLIASRRFLTPWWVLAQPSAEWTQGFMPEFVHRLRQRLPTTIEAYLESEVGSPNHMIHTGYDLERVAGFTGGGRLSPYDHLSFEFAPWCGYAGILVAARWAAKHPGRMGMGEANSLKYEWTVTARKLAYFTGLDTGECSEDLVRELQLFPSKTLEEILPWAGKAQSYVLQAMGLAHLEALRRWLTGFAHLLPYRLCFYDAILKNGSDPADGVVDVAVLKAALDGQGERDVATLLVAFTKIGMMRGMDKLIAAFTGVADREKLFKDATVKLQQPAMKMLGLLPVLDEADVRRRYLALQKLYKEASKYGAQRQATQRAAAQAGLSNLAQVAGYNDSGELEWLMESSQSATLEASLRPQTIGEYEAWIEIDGYSAGLKVRNPAGKVLAKVPAPLKREPALLALKAVLGDIREQFRRFTRLMESRMVLETPVAIAQLQAALAHPVMARILGDLVWQDEARRFGLFSAEGLRGPAGVRPLQGEHLRLIHPVRLLQQIGGAGVLSAWQRWLVAEQRVQPFKQAFRELYVPTPAEQEAGDFSARYAQRPILTGLAQGLLQARGWTIQNDEEPTALSFVNGWTATTYFNTGRYFTEEDQGASGEIRFMHDGETRPLVEVPPACFSEAMRDLDLVVTRAMPDSGGDTLEAHTSGGTIASRIDLLRAIEPTLGGGVLEFRDRHVLVRGQRADYRIHLGSGHIHIEPGAYLCIVPASAMARSGVSLPFAEEDLKTAEIVSKVLLLANDAKIMDPSILRQIPAKLGDASA